eukprot:COSAG06_NODE_4240_length_4440_cov_1.495969_3_plen_285_part_00
MTQRWADTAQSEEEKGWPVILFMHGFPESWFSWRHQMKAARAAGYRGIAPYMRGYGEPDSSKRKTDIAEFNVYRLSADMLSILQHIGARKAALVGHDHGAGFGWSLALLHPEVFTIYSAMSVPYGGRPEGARKPIEEGMRKTYGDERTYKGGGEDDPSNPNFCASFGATFLPCLSSQSRLLTWSVRAVYQLHHQLPDAEEDYAKDTRAALFAMGFGDRSKGSPTPAPVTSKKLFVEGHGSGHPAMWERSTQPTELLDWISQVRSRTKLLSHRLSHRSAVAHCIV